ncbi:hypothetical protein GCM10011496_10220 [Polaromonas eurypsychrophila]|uniref:L,D-transpeptidase n=2 Tax=Polaromonas eurypsychrophila TaxID=1614635 RepID=A0A916SAQ7_9BURK|nr:hypothetical protein GCM10011496_10220 [Polaromonas eurypsychrophila]
MTNQAQEPAGLGVPVSPRRDEDMRSAPKRRGRSLGVGWQRSKFSLHGLGRTGIAGPGLRLALLAASLSLSPAFAAKDGERLPSPSLISAEPSTSATSNHQTQRVQGGRLKRAHFGQERASPEASHVADWIVDSGDNQGMPFMIVDKVHAKVLMFDANGRLQGTAPALLGLARGDDSAPGIGDRKISSILPEERTTAAGRFVVSLGRDKHGQEFLWIDYSTALSLHRVVKGKPSEQRAQRLQSASPKDNRISYGCINVPVNFYDKVVSPAFTGTNGVVYILPETRTAQEVFGSYDVNNQQAQIAKSPDSKLAGPAGDPIK